MDGPSKVKYYDQKELEDFEKLKTQDGPLWGLRTAHFDLDSSRRIRLGLLVKWQAMKLLFQAMSLSPWLLKIS